ncbi:MAG: ECF transporter S component [Oscillospiraceae bacterium]|nr:ECF transporter S component [Oscillospiraceae bacterium]
MDTEMNAKAGSRIGAKRVFDIKVVVVLSMLSAIAYIVASLIRIPLVPAVGFLGYEPKDVVLVIAGFIYGPLAPLVMAAVIALLEGFTTSVMGPIGIPMNFIASCAFACTASFIYKKNRSIAGATIGLSVAVVVTTFVMLLWNYALTPILLGHPRHVVEALLIPGFLPFNLIKGALNAAIAMLLYKPIRKALGKSRLLPVLPAPTSRSSKISVGVVLASVFVIITCTLVVLSWRGII